MSRVRRRRCASSISVREGAVRYCMQLLLATNNAELKILMTRCNQRDIDLALEQEPVKAMVIPSREVWKFVVAKIKKPRLMLKTKTAQAQPNLSVVSGSRIPVLLLVLVGASLLEEYSL